jgi:hypothetical protein
MTKMSSSLGISSFVIPRVLCRSPQTQMPRKRSVHLAEMNARISLQGFADLGQLFVGIKRQIDKDPLATAELASPAAASA